MSLFKPFRGTRVSLDAREKHDGYAYFCTDDGTFHIDYVDDDGSLQRKQINAKDAETLDQHTADEFLLHSELAQHGVVTTNRLGEGITGTVQEYVESMASNPTFIATLLANLPQAEGVEF